MTTRPPAPSQDVLDAAARLDRASVSRRPCAPVRDLLGTDLDSAYAVQRVLTERRLAGGARVVGRKIGLTSPAVQAQLGVDQPDFGVLFDDMLVPAGAPVDSSRLLQPKIEAEIAFSLKADLTEGLLDEAQVRASLDYATAALEIVDSRVSGWNITITDTVADNASSGLFVLSDRRVSLEEFEPADVEMTMWLDDRVVSTGNGRACLGDPITAVSWLARAGRDLGTPLRAGDVVLSGALGPMADVSPGSVVRAEISSLGPVGAAFSAEVHA